MEGNSQQSMDSESQEKHHEELLDGETYTETYQESAARLEQQRLQAEAKLEDVRALLGLRGKLPDNAIKDLIHKVVDPEQAKSDILD